MIIEYPMKTNKIKIWKTKICKMILRFPNNIRSLIVIPTIYSFYTLSYFSDKLHTSFDYNTIVNILFSDLS